MNKKICICMGTGCVANGSTEILNSLKKELINRNLDIEIDTKLTGCHGLCEYGPIIRILPEDISYYRVKTNDIEEIIEKSIKNNTIVDRLLFSDENGNRIKNSSDNPFYKPQLKIATRNVGEIEPYNIVEYIERDGFNALEKVLTMSSTDIISEIENSGLRGRGGAGFLTGKKWRQCASYNDNIKYVVCNGDEGDPGAFLDGSILEGDPFSVIEGLIICAVAIGAKFGFMYIRDEYVLARKNVDIALELAREKGYLGKNICGTDFNFDIRVVRGGGAFVCGESSALMASIEGKVGEPRTKYIRSVQKGLWDKPTVLNNVETLANIPYIISKGYENFKSVGTEKSTGTKVFSLVGKVKRTGLVEVPMGTTIKQLVFDIGGGVIKGRTFKGVQTGGPSGGCIPESMADLPIDFDTLSKYGSMMGSGGVIVMDDRTCMVEIARYYTNFLSEESCGKCTPCREGLRRMLEILTDICEGRGQDGDIEELELIGDVLENTSLCGLGKSAANPVLTTIKYFRNEYENHIKNKTCPVGICKELTTFKINTEKCKKCKSCIAVCPVSAIKEEFDNLVINSDICVSCGTCREKCKFEAIETNGKVIL